MTPLGDEIDRLRAENARLRQSDDRRTEMSNETGTPRMDAVEPGRESEDREADCR